MQISLDNLLEHRANAPYTPALGLQELLVMAPGGSTTCFGSSSTTSCCAVIYTDDEALGLSDSLGAIQSAK